MTEPDLSEPVEGLFVLRSEYGDRAIPKDAGFRWHSGYRCRRKDCRLCAEQLVLVWWSEDPIKALDLLPYADAALAASIKERAGPAAAER